MHKPRNVLAFIRFPMLNKTFLPDKQANKPVPNRVKLAIEVSRVCVRERRARLRQGASGRHESRDSQMNQRAGDTHDGQMFLLLHQTKSHSEVHIVSVSFVGNMPKAVKHIHLSSFEPLDPLLYSHKNNANLQLVLVTFRTQSGVDGGLISVPCSQNFQNDRKR